MFQGGQEDCRNTHSCRVVDTLRAMPSAPRGTTCLGRPGCCTEALALPSIPLPGSCWGKRLAVPCWDWQSSCTHRTKPACLMPLGNHTAERMEQTGVKRETEGERGLAGASGSLCAGWKENQVSGDQQVGGAALQCRKALEINPLLAGGLLPRTSQVWQRVTRPRHASAFVPGNSAQAFSAFFPGKKWGASTYEDTWVAYIFFLVWIIFYSVQ